MFCLSKWLIQLVFWKVSPGTTEKFKKQQNKTLLPNQWIEGEVSFRVSDSFPCPSLCRSILLQRAQTSEIPLHL